MMERLALTPEKVFGSQWVGWGRFLGTGRTYNSPEQWVSIAEDMAQKNGGRLQSVAWLVGNGFVGLYAAMLNKPSLFKHIEQDRHLKSPEEWVVIAKEMANKNGGQLQSMQWLEKNGHTGLTQTIRKYPGLFGRVKQKTIYRQHRTPEQWVSVAHELVRENGGKFPQVRWLNKHGYSGLYESMRNHPSLFAHFKRERRSSQARVIPDQGATA